MSLAEIMEAIEDYRFSSELNLAAGTKAFRRGLREHDLFRRLAGLAKEPEARDAVAMRIEVLSKIEVDSVYENRFDVALSAYLLVLGDIAEPEVYGKAAEAVTKAANTWWAFSISHELLTNAIARGWLRVPSANTNQRAITILVPRKMWSGSLRDKVQAWISQRADFANSERQYILRGLNDAEMGAQITKASNLTAMPAPKVILNVRRRRRPIKIERYVRSAPSAQPRRRERARA